MTKFRCFLVWMVWSMAGIGTLPAEGQVVLKPNGQNAVPLHLKALQADATIDHQFATTHTTMTFQNETEERIEADFIYTLPPGAIVTYFAYWYGDEKVVARVVEKEEAAAIYAHITARMHDPALVEMIGKNTFRARIFPVMPNSDLKVEMTIMQALPSDRQGCFYTFPLHSEASQQLSSLRFRVHVQSDPSLVRVTDNYGLEMPLRRDGYNLLLTGTSYRPPHDLRINLTRIRQPVQAALYAAPSGGRDGFFALALTPDRPLRRPRMTIRGVATYQIVPARLSGVKAYGTLTLFGRYRGSGPATVTLTGQSSAGHWSHTAGVVFGAARRPQNVASKLWAARRIEQLGTNREAVIALSKQFCLPSRFTSWLAVPKEEMERYRQEKAQAEAEVVARRLAREITQGRDRSRLALQLRTRLDTLCRLAEEDPREILEEQLYNEVSMQAQTIVTQLLHGQENSPMAQRARARLAYLCRQTGRHPQSEIAYRLDSKLGELADTLLAEQASPRLRGTYLASLRRQLTWLAHAAGNSPHYYLNAAEYRATHVERIELLDQFLQAAIQSHPDRRQMQQAEAKLIALRRRYGHEDNPLDDPSIRTARQSLEAVDQQIDTFQLRGSSDALSALQQRRTEMAEQLEQAIHARMGDPLIQVEAPADARQVVAILPGGEVKPLSWDAARGRWEARFDIPTYARQGRYVITILIVLQGGIRRMLTFAYYVDLTPPHGSGQAQVVTAPRPTLRLEMDTSEDTTRVVALLPWGDKVVLQPAAQPHRFFGLTPLPAGKQNTPPVVTFVLTDRAHNRTRVTVDPTEH